MKIKILALIYILAVLVFSARANALNLDSNPDMFLKEHQIEQVEELKVQDPLPEFNFQTVRLVNSELV